MVYPYPPLRARYYPAPVYGRHPTSGERQPSEPGASRE